MAIYHFDCFDGERLHTDPYGVDLAQRDEIVDQSAALAHSLLCETRTSGTSHMVSIMVRSSSGAYVYIVNASLQGTFIGE